MFSKKILTILLSTAIVFLSCNNEPKVVERQLTGEIKAELTDAPVVPKPIVRGYPTKVIVDLEVEEVVQRLADGVDYTFWTFGGKVPGKFIRVREGDMVEFRLHNAKGNKNPHNIDLHAVTGPGGGATSSLTAPGKTSVFTFKVLNPGLYVYHCATAPVGMHIANGMYGMILVEPREGLPKVDREYYLMQGEFYTRGKYGEEGLQPFNMEKALHEDPDYVVFNGSVGSLVGDNAIIARVGETVRLFVGNAGPNLVSSFHIIGEIFDNVSVEAGSLKNQNVQTTLIPAGGATIVEFKVDVPGTFIIVDHSIFRAFNKGALGMLKVEGNENKQIYGGRDQEKEEMFVYINEGATIQSMPADQPAEIIDFATLSMDEIMDKGLRIYKGNCMACHQSEGQGFTGVFPPLANSDYLMADRSRAIHQLLNGSEGDMTVNGTVYNGVMPAQELTDDQVASVLTFITNSWGNKGDKFTPEEVNKVRGQE